jgi:hypothetical protein
VPFCLHFFLFLEKFIFHKAMKKSVPSFQVGKGRDVGLNQIALFEGKVAGGNGEQVLSRDVYRLGQLFDFFRMLTFFFTTVGYYVCTMVLSHSLLSTFAPSAHVSTLWLLFFFSVESAFCKACQFAFMLITGTSLICLFAYACR